MLAMLAVHATLEGDMASDGGIIGESLSEGTDMATGAEPIIAAKAVWPFFVAATATAAARPNLNRILEAVVIAALTAGGTTYSMAKVSETKIAALESNITQLQQDIREMRALLMQSRFSPIMSGKSGQ